MGVGNVVLFWAGKPLLSSFFCFEAQRYVTALFASACTLHIYTEKLQLSILSFGLFGTFFEPINI